MRAVITVIGKDIVGILAKISTECCNHNINVLEVTQSILQDMFAMIMLVELENESVKKINEELMALADEMGLGKTIQTITFLLSEKISSIEILKKTENKV